VRRKLERWDVELTMKLCSLILLAILATTPIFVNTREASSSLTTLYVNPSSQLVPLGGHFSVDVDLTNASSLYGYQIWLSFDPTKLSATAIENASYLNPPTETLVQIINNTGGYIFYAIMSVLPAQPKNGGSPPSLVTIDFTALALGISTLHINSTNTILASSVNGGTAIPYQTSDGTVTIQSGVVWAQAGEVGITGYKLLFEETMNNSLSSQETISYYWNFTADKWNGTQWVATGISGSSALAGSTIGALTTVDLPYYVYHLNSSGPNAVAWNEWLEVSFTFHWTYGGTGYSTAYTEELNVHPADVTGAASVTFPYLGAVGSATGLDLHLLGLYWLQSVPSGTNPTSALARADIGDFGSVSGEDLHILAQFWLLSWKNTPPSST